MSALRYWIWLTTRHDLGPAGVLGVLEHFITPERAYYATRRNMTFFLSPLLLKGACWTKARTGRRKFWRTVSGWAYVL